MEPIHHTDDDDDRNEVRKVADGLGQSLIGAQSDFVERTVYK